MVDEPGFFSAEGFPYPLLALGQTFPRGYQYQSQMTPYKRDARGDWGRALNESIDQFFGMWPQYLQQKRQFALQREQLNRQRMSDKHQAKLRPFELKEAEAADRLRQRQMQMWEDYPQQVKGLKVSDEIKSYLLTQTPEAGNKFLQTYYQHKFKPKKQFLTAEQTGLGKPAVVSPDGDIKLLSVDQQLVTLKPGESLAGTNIVNNSQEDIQVNPWTKDIKTPFKVQRKIVPIQEGNPLIGKLKSTFGEEWVTKMMPFIKEDRTYAKEGEPGEIIMPQGFETLSKDLQEKQIAKTAQTPSQLFQTKHAESNYANIQQIGDLGEVAGNNLTAQRIAAIQLLPENHEVRQRAQYELKQAGVKMGRNGIFEPEPFKPSQLQQKPRSTASAPQSILVEKGNSLDQIVEDFKAKGITVDPTQVVAANKHFFPEGNPNKMKASADVGGAEMLIPVGGGSLSESQVNAAHRSSDPRHNVTTIPGSGTYTSFNNATVPTAIKLNNDLAEMKKMQSNVDEVVGLMKDPNALGLLETGHPARGLIEGLRWRLINNVQVLRDFGVLSSREIETIAKSIPDINSTFNWASRKIFGLKPESFVKGVLGALKAEGITKANQLRAFMGAYGVKEVDFKIHQFDPYASQDQGSASKQFVDSFREN